MSQSTDYPCFFILYGRKFAEKFYKDKHILLLLHIMAKKKGGIAMGCGCGCDSSFMLFLILILLMFSCGCGICA